ncbi:MAG: protein kinase, partial [Deltaproteobacteria bacterium]|nr:protein kinase [Deltaproteobacteria bacterium]
MSQTFGKFKIIERIGGGRLSQVFRIDRNWSSTAAEPQIVLKRVAPELIAERAFVQLVTREAGVLSRLSHENLCVCQEMGVIDGCAFLTLEQVDGCTLRALLRRLSQMRIGLTTSAVLAIAYQAARVLDYLHRQCSTPLAHLDLSPQNVMITRDGTLRLIDFGIARFLSGDDPPP